MALDSSSATNQYRAYRETSEGQTATATVDESLHAGEDLTNDVQKVEQRFNYTNITTAATTTVKSGSGFLHSITINKLVASAVITIYDNTAGSGTKIGTITYPATLLTDSPVTVEFNVSFGIGLTIVTSVANDLTINYR